MGNIRLAITVVATFVVVAVCSGCAGGPLSPAEMAFRRTTETASRWSDGVDAPIRYNPARCECPEFEILLDGAWLRAEIINDIADDPIMTELYRSALSAGPGYEVRIVGRVRGVQKQRYRSAVIRLEIKSICTDATCTGGAEGGAGPAGSTDGRLQQPGG